MKKILLTSLVVFLFAGCGVKDFRSQTKEDRLNFKEEYERLNLEVDDEGIPKYKQLSISEDNKVIYLSYEELLDFLENGSGLLYFGRPGCPWCRPLVPTLLKIAENKKTYIYYYNIENDRTEDNANYKNILSLLDEYLPKDVVTQKEDDDNFNKDLKRVVLPHLFFIKKGKIKDEIMLYEHEYIKNNDDNKMYDLLIEKYNKIK